MKEEKLPCKDFNLLDNMSDNLDMFGNSVLHNLFGNPEIDVDTLNQILLRFPDLVRLPNKLGRLPLHYAVDRGKVNRFALEILLNKYPEGINISDNENRTPWDLVKNWDHNKAIKWLFLSKYPELDQDQYMKMKYGPLGSFAVWATHATNISHETEPTADMMVEEEDDAEEFDDDVFDNEMRNKDILQSISSSSPAQYGKELNPDDAEALDRRVSIAEVTEFEDILGSGSLKHRKTLSSQSGATLFSIANPPISMTNSIKDSSSPGIRRFSVTSVHSFEEEEITEKK